MDPRPLEDATALAAAIRGGELSSRELLDAQVARADALLDLAAVVTRDLERARAEASAADADAAAGRWRGPLHGLPITVKDALEVAGVRSTGGAVELSGHVPAADAPVVARLRAAGAVVWGKTNVPRWSGDIQTSNELFGTTANPWDPARTPGGSSGGAAVAVATGMTAFEIGTDIGGSIRTPSGWTGICGHKPTWGVVTQRGYLDHVGGGRTDADLNVVGPLARSVRDLQLVLDVIAGPDADRAAGWRLDLPGPPTVELAGLRVGTWLDDPVCPVDAEVLAVLEGAAAALAGAGARVEPSRPPFAPAAAVACFSALVTAAVSVSFDDADADAVSGSHRAWLRADEERAALRAAWARWFDAHDVVLLPVMSVVAPRHDHGGDLFTRTVEVNGVATPHISLLAWAGVVGVAYLPSTVVPAGRSASGLPVGIQVVGPHLGDRTTLAVARHLEAVLGGYLPPPMATA